MMNDDVSSIPTTGCSVLTSPTSISNYNARTRLDFTFLGGKWYPYRTQTSAYNDYDISSFSCIDVSGLRSYNIYTPIVYGIAFLLFAFSIFLFFTTIKGFIYGIK